MLLDRFNTFAVQSLDRRELAAAGDVDFPILDFPGLSEVQSRRCNRNQQQTMKKTAFPEHEPYTLG